MYVGSDKLYAFNGQTGVKLWEFETDYTDAFNGNVYWPRPDQSCGTGAILDSGIYVGVHGDGLKLPGNYGNVYALNGNSKLWEFETGDSICRRIRWYSVVTSYGEYQSCGNLKRYDIQRSDGVVYFTTTILRHTG